VRVRSTLTAVGAAALLAACGGGGEDPAPPAPVPAGFVAVQGKHYSFARPRDWVPIEVEPEKGKEVLGFQQPGAPAGGLPAQVGLGVNPRYAGELDQAVRLAKDESRIVYPEYRITAERRVEMKGAKAYRIDAEYASFTEVPVKVRTVDLLVRTSAGVQLNFFVRSRAADFERLGLARILDTFRAR